MNPRMTQGAACNTDRQIDCALSVISARVLLCGVCRYYVRVPKLDTLNVCWSGRLVCRRFGNLPIFLWCLLDHGSSGVDPDGVSVMEGDSVTLNTGVQTNQQDRIRWYYNDIRIAQINRDQSKICTDVQCNDGNKRFRDRLKLDHQTGSLTIMNITNTDAGVYQLQISSGSSDSEKTFNVILYGVSAAERDKIKRKSVNEGEPVTLYTGVIINLNDSIAWYINEILIAEICDEPRKTCTDVQCEERFRDRLKLDHQTGSLTITHTRNTHSGEYKLQINNSRFSIIRSFSVSVTAVPDAGLSSAAVGGICAAVILLVAAAAAVIYCLHWKSRKRKARQKGNRTPRDDHDQDNDVKEAVPLNQRTETPQMDDDNGTSHNETETALMDDDNETEIPQMS
ncbi:uncharacterized protein LOC130087013 [Rhinichthys klamathensis goyatoka]|uniref:uncharacterized protein LOC130087013 n=1 Tax=Rhinichthys klamathensis goyatoka TaxID=3034132 RepID=UPI0024B5BAD1|nr:uncharacterized protein LOC130087013 [Rhinichthys klamathensis goyatoka]